MTTTITLSGVVDPLAALDLRVRLHDATSAIRPAVCVDLHRVEAIHPAGIAALISAARQAARRGGHLQLVNPVDAAAQRDLDLASWFPPAVQPKRNSR